MPLASPPLDGSAAFATEEAFVVSHDQIGLDPLHEVERDTDHDQEPGAAQKGGDTERNAQVYGYDGWNHGDEG